MKRYNIYFTCFLFFFEGIFSVCFASSIKHSNNTSEFHSESISSELKNILINNGIWNNKCPTKIGDLRLLKVKYYDLSGHPRHDGKIIVHKSVTDNALQIFKKLYSKRFPFSSIDTLVKFKGNWQEAEASNVTYGYICKFDSTKGYSTESYGNVITINPIFNPEITLITSNQEKKIQLNPREGIFSVNRKLKLKGMTESVENIFKSKKFIRLELPENQIGWKKFIFQKEIKQLSSNKSYFLTNSIEQQTTFISNIEPLTPTIKQQLINKKLWDVSCPAPLERLCMLTLSYYDFNGNSQTGNLIVFDTTAPYFVDAFKELYKLKFPLEQVLSFANNNGEELTIAFNCRNIVGEKSMSIHSYGLAIDINILRNPYAGAFKISNMHAQGNLIPYSKESLSYLNRKEQRLGMNEAIVEIMAKNGFIEWGGNWQDRIDYMHFQIPKSIAENLIFLDLNTGKALMDLMIRYPEAAKKMSADERWKYLYQFYPKTFSTALKKYFPRLQKEKEITVINLIYNELIYLDSKSR